MRVDCRAVVVICGLLIGCDGAPTEPSRVTPSRPSPSDYADDHGDTPLTATLIIPPSIVDGYLHANDIDYFRIDVSRHGLLLVRTTGNSDTYGYLHDRYYSIELANDDGGAGYNFRIDTTVSPGTYYVAVSGSLMSDTGAYTFRADLRR